MVTRKYGSCECMQTRQYGSCECMQTREYIARKYLRMASETLHLSGAVHCIMTLCALYMCTLYSDTVYDNVYTS